MKTTMKTGFAALVLLLAFSCKKELLNKTTSAISQAQDEVSIKTAGHYIGERFGGGVIFLLDSTGRHGLIADTIDIGNFTWLKKNNYTITGASETAIGTGKTNTKKIILTFGKSGTYAALECTRSQRSGYTDWFLPSKDELNELNKQKSLIGGSFTGTYFSSSEYSNTEVWVQDFYFNGQSHSGKGNNYFVRAIRTFK